jgi:hypothetical protein
VDPSRTQERVDDAAAITEQQQGLCSSAGADSDSVAGTVALGPGDLLPASPGHYDESIAGEVVDVELGLMNVDIDQGVPVRVANAQPGSTVDHGVIGVP